MLKFDARDCKASISFHCVTNISRKNKNKNKNKNTRRKEEN